MKLGPAAVLEEREVHALLDACSRRAPTGIRDAALITTLWRTGLRIGEALDLEASRVRLTASPPTLVVRDSKTPDGVRTVALCREATGALQRWLATREKLGLGRRGKLFCTLQGEPMHQDAVRHMLRRRAKRARLGDTRVHPHAFRATLAVELRRAGEPLEAIQDVLGHAGLSSTGAYLRRLDPHRATAALLRRDQPDALSAALDQLDAPTRDLLWKALEAKR